MTYLKRKGISLSPKVYFIDALSYMALGLFATLVVGLILKTAGGLLSLPLIIKMGTLAMGLMGPAIGVAVAYRLHASPLIIFASVVSGAAGAELGGPAGSFAAALIGVEFGKLVSGETRIDIILTPLVTIITGFFTAALIGPGIEAMMTGLGRLIMWGTDQNPLIMGMLVATIVGLALSSPISSAALALMLDLSGLAAGAATIGCCAQMVGFAAAGFRENRFGGLAAVGIGTSKLQLSNIVKNPLILIPPTIAGLILAPIGIIGFGMVNNAAGAGMGTSGLVGQLMTLTVMGFHPSVFLAIALLHIVGPAVISLVVSEWMRKKGYIQFGDLTIQTGGMKHEKN